MFCGNCGGKLNAQTNFCGNCGARVAQNPLHTKEKKSNNLSRTIKQEISSLPLVSLIGDSVKGASGLSQLQDQLKENKNDPLLWMFYYEGLVTYKKMKMGVSAARIVYNPIGFAVSKGIATGLNVLDNEYEAFDPKKCLAMSLALCMESVKNGSASPLNLMIIGKSLFYMGINEDQAERRESFLLRSIKYLTLAIQAEKNEHFIAEYFFYLSQVYGIAGNTKLQYRALNISRKMGFIPSFELLKKYLKDRGMTEEKISTMSVNEPPTRINQFQFTFKPGAVNRIESSLKFTLQEQSKKIKTTSTRIKKFFS
jgi:hypothetical protein